MSQIWRYQFIILFIILKKKSIRSKPLNIDILNNLEFKKIDYNQFPLTKILNLLPKKNSLYETALISINDFFVIKFLSKKINYNQLISLINKFSHDRNFTKFRKIPVKSIEEIYKIRDYVSFKLNTLGI